MCTLDLASSPTEIKCILYNMYCPHGEAQEDMYIYVFYIYA